MSRRPFPHIALPAAILLLAASLAGPAAADMIDTGKILSAASGDFNKDGKSDLAMLVANGEDGVIDVHILLQDAEHNLLVPTVVAGDKVSGNVSLEGMFGQDPAITALPNGSLAITSQNEAIGRDRWRQTLTIAWRNKAFVVAGFTHEWYDTLDLDNAGSCDLNVLTGKGKRGDKAISVEPAYVLLTDWDDRTGMKACGIGE